MATKYKPKYSMANKKKMCKLGSIYLTCTEKETHTFTNEITSRAVEDQSNINDNVKRQPRTLEISGSLFGMKEYPTVRAKKLEEYFNKQKVIKYVGRKSMSKCIIESLAIDYTADIAHGFNFTITLKQIKIASKETVNIKTRSLSVPNIEKLKEKLEEAKEKANEAKKKKKSKSKTKKKTKSGKKSKSSKSSNSVGDQILALYKKK